MPYYLNPSNVGVSKVFSNGNNSTITLKWYRAFPTTISNKIAYNIYMDTELPVFETDFFNKSPAFVSVDGTLTVEITDLTPGQMYRFAVRPVEYDPDIFDLADLPTTFNDLRVYPESELRSDITATSSVIPLLSVEDFPSTGTVKIGSELIQYSSLNSGSNNLILTNVGLQRGYNDTEATNHTVDGYDGYVTWDPAVLFWPVDIEDRNTVVFATPDRFDVGNYAFNLVDGYRQATSDFVNADLTANDTATAEFPSFAYVGYHRTDPVALLRGECVGSYFGGQMYCVDGYEGVGRVLRGISANDLNTQRQEVLLSVIGEPVCLVKRQWLGIRCSCILATNEFPDARCTKCYGTGFVVGWSQFFYPRSSDGRIRVRFDPWVDDLELTSSGLEPEIVKPNGWTLTYPAIKKRDFIVRFDQDGNEEFRYEVINVTRNVLFPSATTTGNSLGAQKLSLQRIRKTDQLYMVKVFRDTSTMPVIITTSINSSTGLAPHSHTFVKNENNPATWQQISSISQGHSHILAWSADDGVLTVSQELGHSHTITY